MSVNVVPRGATPLTTNSTRPNGGVIVAISMLSSMIAPNQIGEKPSVVTIGKKIGIVSIMIDSGSMKQPMISMTTCIAATTSNGDSGMAITVWTRPDDAPVKARICENAVEPVMIISIITET